MALHDPTGQWFIINAGRRRGDGAVAMDWFGGRLILITNANFVTPGMALEEIPMGPGLKRIAAVLHAPAWPFVCFVALRDGWGPDDYFIHAARLLGERSRAS